MKNFWSNIRLIALKDLKLFFYSPMAYLVASVFTGVIALFFYPTLIQFLQASQAYVPGQMGAPMSLAEGLVRPVFANSLVVILFLVPFVTMRSFSEERKNQTLALYFTSPVRLSELVIGKFLSHYFLLLLMLMGTGIFWLAISPSASFDIGQLLSSYLGFGLYLAALVSLGVFCSSLTDNQMIAGVIHFAATFVLILIGFAATNASTSVSEALMHLSVINHYMNFAMGMIHSVDVIYYVSFTGFLLYLTHQKLSQENELSKFQFKFQSYTQMILVMGIVFLINFFAYQNPFKADLTASKINSLTPQSLQALQQITDPIEFTYWSKAGNRESVRPLLNLYKTSHPKVSMNFIDPEKEPLKAKGNQITQNDLLQIKVGTRDLKLIGANEEKVTNALMKLSSSKEVTICSLTQHGERDFESTQPDGYYVAKKLLELQNYKVQAVNLIEKPEIPKNCQVLAILGPLKAFYGKEKELIQSYLQKGGKALITLDLNVQTELDYSSEMTAILKTYGITIQPELVIDLYSKQHGVEPTLPLLETFNPESSITKNLVGKTVFPMTRPITYSVQKPELKIQWLAKTSPTSYGEKNLKDLLKGKSSPDSVDSKGPFEVAVLVEDSHSKTKFALFSNTFFASNAYYRSGNNLDFFMNTLSYLAGDESLIPIQGPKETITKLSLTDFQTNLLFYGMIFILPLCILGSGLFFWIRRRKL
jgi:ABC-type transport system involved in multi-copper enzyme maturation permease subunit